MEDKYNGKRKQAHIISYIGGGNPPYCLRKLFKVRIHNPLHTQKLLLSITEIKLTQELTKHHRTIRLHSLSFFLLRILLQLMAAFTGWHWHWHPFTRGLTSLEPLLVEPGILWEVGWSHPLPGRSSETWASPPWGRWTQRFTELRSVVGWLARTDHIH